MLAVNELMDNARAKLANVKSEEIFLLRDFFKGNELNAISRSDKLLLDTLFLNYIKSNDLRIALIEKTSSGNREIK